MADYFWQSVEALCPDMKVRRIRARHHRFDGSLAPTTAFSVPARLTHKGMSVRGYLTVQTVAGLQTPSFNDPATLKFVPFNRCNPWSDLA